MMTRGYVLSSSRAGSDDVFQFPHEVCGDKPTEFTTSHVASGRLPRLVVVCCRCRHHLETIVVVACPTTVSPPPLPTIMGRNPTHRKAALHPGCFIHAHPSNVGVSRAGIASS